VIAERKSIPLAKHVRAGRYIDMLCKPSLTRAETETVPEKGGFNTHP